MLNALQQWQAVYRRGRATIRLNAAIRFQRLAANAHIQKYLFLNANVDALVILPTYFLMFSCIANPVMTLCDISFVLPETKGRRKTWQFEKVIPKNSVLVINGYVITSHWLQKMLRTDL